MPSAPEVRVAEIRKFLGREDVIVRGGRHETVNDVSPSGPELQHISNQTIESTGEFRTIELTLIADGVPVATPGNWLFRHHYDKTHDRKWLELKVVPDPESSTLIFTHRRFIP